MNFRIFHQDQASTLNQGNGILKHFVSIELSLYNNILTLFYLLSFFSELNCIIHCDYTFFFQPTSTFSISHLISAALVLLLFQLTGLQAEEKENYKRAQRSEISKPVSLLIL